MRVFLRGHLKDENTGLVGKFICKFTWGKFKHTSGCFLHDNGYAEGFESNTKDGCHFFEWEDLPSTEVFEIDCTDEEAQAMYRRAQELDGCGYDFKGIVGFIRRRKREDPDKYFCSEVWSTIPLCVDIVLQRLPPFKQSPMIQLASPLLIEHGNVKIQDLM